MCLPSGSFPWKTLFYIFGKTAKPRLDFFNLLRTWRGNATGIVCKLLLVDACSHGIIFFVKKSVIPSFSDVTY